MVHNFGRIDPKSLDVNDKNCSLQERELNKKIKQYALKLDRTKLLGEVFKERYKDKYRFLKQA